MSTFVIIEKMLSVSVMATSANLIYAFRVASQHLNGCDTVQHNCALRAVRRTMEVGLYNPHTLHGDLVVVP